MSEEIRGVPVQESAGGGVDDREVGARHGDDAGKLMVVANVALVGVPAAYTASQSVLVTIIAAVVAVVFLFVYLACRGR